MPFYEFRCPTCEERFEAQRPMADRDAPTSCPNGHDGAVRVITSVGVTGGIRYGTPAAAARKGPLGGSAKPSPKDPPTSAEADGQA